MWNTTEPIVNQYDTNMNPEDTNMINYITKLLKEPKMVDGKHNQNLKEINENIGKIYKTVERKKNTHKLKKLLNEEENRLNEQKKNVETAKINQQRSITLNENYVKRYREYFKIFILSFLWVLFLLLLSILNVPVIMITILSIITGGLVMIYSINTYVSILSRDNVYFDEISQEPPTFLTKNAISKKIQKNKDSGNLIDSVNLKSCSGNACCSTSTIWDPKTQLCVVMLKDGFSTIESAYTDNMIVDKQKKIDRKEINVLPFHNTEYDHYSTI